MGVERLGTSCPAPPSATCPSANPSRNCTGKQLGRQWPTGGNPGYYRLDLPKVSGYDACCEECKSDYACKRFMGGKRGCTLLYDAADATLAKGPRKSYVGVIQPAV